MHHAARLCLLALFAAACAASAYQGQDRPENPALPGVPPPQAFGCERGTIKLTDTDHDGRNDKVERLLNGAAICRGEDTNGDGKLDRWTSLQGDKAVDQVSDVDYDGDFDEHRRDSDGNGSFDYEGAYLPEKLSLPPNWVVEEQKKSQSQ